LPDCNWQHSLIAYWSALGFPIWFWTWEREGEGEREWENINHMLPKSNKLHLEVCWYLPAKWSFSVEREPILLHHTYTSSQVGLQLMMQDTC
jgi:hypothetical protein